MIIFPAVDIKAGKVVRLMQGKFDQVTEYAQDPASVALQWEAQGAQWLHVVDLDGAKTGHLTNLDTIQSIIQTVQIPVQVGGGIRSELDVEQLLQAGVKRVILGTQAINNQDLLKHLILKWPDAVAVSVDASNGFVSKLGWTENTDILAVDFVKKLENLGLKCLIFTDIARDGMLTGPNLEILENILDTTGVPLIASGGISSIEDIKKLNALTSKGLIGAITGKALYEGTLDLKKALELTNSAH